MESNNNNNCNLSVGNTDSRGALIVLEGLDRCGKTSQSGKLLSHLEGLGHSAELWRFPDRTTSVGQMISAYLLNQSQLDDHTIHLLFSANRWEKSQLYLMIVQRQKTELCIWHWGGCEGYSGAICALGSYGSSLGVIISLGFLEHGHSIVCYHLRSMMETKLKAGTTLIVDRYSYSGVAFSSAKGVDVEWCKAPEMGLLAPDVVLFLDIPPEKAAERGGYGGERYEHLEFQKKVAQCYQILRDSSWKMAAEGIDEVEKELHDIVVDHVLACKKGKPLSLLWSP
ncbi:hypothetical protein Patl1_02959 [Pistacia atlantica]|uniref:Uncharacterized protein n=1 Tax=Pistacia atlantica TaxID=434234 RepID=A0ACC1CDF4_9ROSI|nr:hypothetical protein Patl1_02959 [Pistacia atlantica]